MAVSLLLPDAQRWRAAPRDSWWSIAHEPTHSVLELKRWRADGLVRPDDCEADAMLWRPELRDAGKPVVEERRFMTEAEVEFALRVHAEAGHDGSTRGRVHAHGASLRECLSFVFTTRAVGGDAPAIVAERLQLVADHVVPSLMPLRVEQRVERIRRQ